MVAAANVHSVGVVELAALHGEEVGGEGLQADEEVEHHRRRRVVRPVQEPAEEVHVESIARVVFEVQDLPRTWE